MKENKLSPTGDTKSNLIIKPVTLDGLAGYDQFNQFVAARVEHGGLSHYFVKDVRHDVCTICGHGWAPTADAILDQVHWRLIDKHVHESCLSRYVGFNERALVYRALVGAHVRFSGLRPIPNKYRPESHHVQWMPWYEAWLIDHPVMFEIGMRRHVWSVTVRPTDGDLPWWQKAMTAFDAFDVTKEFSEKGLLVHAWGDDKLVTTVKLLVDAGGLAAV